jgi:methionyl aminopeptidase
MPKAAIPQERKSSREISLMRQAGLLVWEAHHLVAAKVTPGVTTGELDAIVEQFFAKHNATPLFKGVPGKKIPFPAVCCMSVNEEVVHGIPGRRVLQEGDIISVDTGCRYQGWCGDAAVTHPVGTVSAEAQRLLEVTRGTLLLAIEQLGVCRMWSEVATQMEKYVKDQGFSVVENLVGHGIGRDMHEEPQVPNYWSRRIRQDADFRLEPGLVIAIEPMVNIGSKRVRTLRDTWTEATSDGSLSAHFEHTVALTENGPQVLTAAPDGAY